MKVHIKTFGCSLNHADSETMAGQLLESGHELAEESEADVIVYNTCTVKNPTQDSFLANLKKQEKPVVIAGCMPQADKQNLFEDYTTLGTEQLLQINKAVDSAVSGNKVKLLQIGESKRLNLPKIRINPFVEIVPICKGCLSNCTYCKTKQARGNLESYRPIDIETQCKQAIKEGVKEIWLTSQDNGAYGMDIKSNPGELLERIANLEGDFMIRFGMTNPDWTKKWLPELIKAFKHEKVYKFLHLPIQAGSDSVLKHMGRRCTADDIRYIVSEFRKEIPDITIATDIICGYPTETDEDFEDTMNLLEELDFPIVNISKFYSRPDTKASTLKQLPSEVVKERSRKVSNWFNSKQDQHKNLVGKNLAARFTEYKDKTNFGKTNNYIQVLLHSEKDLSGTTQLVNVKETTRDDLKTSLA